MARRLRKMKAHECGECVNLGDRHRLDSRKLGERFVKASHVLCEPSRGVVVNGQAILKTAHNKLVGDAVPAHGNAVKIYSQASVPQAGMAA